MATIWKTIFFFPSSSALITFPSDTAIERSPVIANSLPTITTTIQAGARPRGISMMRAAETMSLSANGSRNLPKVVTN